MDAQTGAVTKVESDPLGKVDLTGATSPRSPTNDPYHHATADDRTRIYLDGQKFEKDYN